MDDNKKPTGAIIIPKDDKQLDGFYCEIYYDKPTPQELEKAGRELTKNFFPEFLEKIKKELPSQLNPINFHGAAETYMHRNSIRFSKKIRGEYAKAIYDDFIKYLESDELIEYNEDSGTIKLSPFILALENGDFFMPGLHLVSKALEEYFEKLANENTDN